MLRLGGIFGVIFLKGHIHFMFVRTVIGKKQSVSRHFQTGGITLPEPEIEFLWCFKKGEYDRDYTVVPVKEIMGKKDGAKDTVQQRRMEETYRDFLSRNLIKHL